MKCPFCGAGPARWAWVCKPSLAAAGMNEMRRSRVCPRNEAHRFRTTEIDAAELADLRRRAHLYEMAIGSATKEAA